jgi:hypothetical protein
MKFFFISFGTTIYSKTPSAGIGLFSAKRADPSNYGSADFCSAAIIGEPDI